MFVALGSCVLDERYLGLDSADCSFLRSVQNWAQIAVRDEPHHHLDVAVATKAPFLGHLHHMLNLRVTQVNSG